MVHVSKPSVDNPQNDPKNFCISCEQNQMHTQQFDHPLSNLRENAKWMNESETYDGQTN